MGNTENRKCENCIWGDWCDIKDPNSEMCGLYGDEVSYENSLTERIEVYTEEILEYDDGGIEVL